MASYSPDRTCTKLLIDLDEGENTEELETLLKLQPSHPFSRQLTKVSVESHWEEVEDWIHPETLPSIFSSLGRLENLQQLHLNLGCGIHLPVGLVAATLEQSPRLNMLCLDSVILAGKKNDFDVLGQVVSQSAALTCVCLSDVQILPTLDDHQEHQEASLEAQAQLLEPFLVSLVQKCPTMRVLELEEVPTSVGVLQAIASSLTLKEVEIWNIPSAGESMEDFANSLQSNSTLEKLELCNCEIGSKGGQALTKMLLQNRSLNTVALDIDWGMHTMFGRPIASILESNHTLTRLHLVCRQQNTPQKHSAEVYAQMICQSLAKNNHLERLALEFRQSRTSGNDNSRLAAAFTAPLKQALLHQNFTLQEFALTGGRSFLPIAWSQDVAFYLGLNEAGRKGWISAASNIDWMETLNQHKNDLSTNFYILSLHPHLICAHK